MVGIGLCIGKQKKNSHCSCLEWFELREGMALTLMYLQLQIVQMEREDCANERKMERENYKIVQMEREK